MESFNQEVSGAERIDDPMRVFIHKVFSLNLSMLSFYLEE